MAENLIEAGEEFDRFVGSFVREYARLEFILRIAMKRHSGLDDETYDILIGLPNTDQIVGKLRKLFPKFVADGAAQQEAERAFGHLENLTRLRNNLVHYSGQAEGVGHVLIRAKPSQIMKDTGFAYSIHEWREMHDALEDLTLIATFLHFHLVSQPKTKAIRNLARESVRLPSAWLYKPPQLLQNR